MGFTFFISYKKILFSIVLAFVAILYRDELKLYFNSHSNEIEDKVGVYSEHKLAQFNGITQKKLYLAICGIVFDVTEGKRYYGKGAAYNYFVGKDGSRALITGDFKDESKNKDHVIDLSCNELFTLLNWRKTFKQKYIEVGVLKGKYFDENGKETVYAKEFKNKIKQCKIEKENNKKEDMKYPPCNIEWNEENGTKVWCTKSSGGISRSWAGVPRQLYSPGVEKPRCICLNTNAEETSSGLIKEYDNCSNISTVCFVQT